MSQPVNLVAGIENTAANSTFSEGEPFEKTDNRLSKMEKEILSLQGLKKEFDGFIAESEKRIDRFIIQSEKHESWILAILVGVGVVVAIGFIQIQISYLSDRADKSNNYLPLKRMEVEFN